MVFAPAFVAMKNACCAAGAVPPIDYEKAVLCAPNGDRVIVISAITGGVPIPTGYNMDGTVYAGALNALTACDTADVESDAVLMCDGGTVEFLRWFVKRDGFIVGTPFDTNMAGVAYTPVSAVTMGACAVAAVPNSQLTYFDRLGGAGDAQSIITSTGALNLYSITLWQINGTGSVTGDAGSTVPLYAGQTVSWSAVNLNLENLNSSLLAFDSGSGEMHVTAKERSFN